MSALEGFERLWTGRRDVVETCDPCERTILPGEGRVILADDQQHIVTMCAGCYIRRLDAAIPKTWPATNTLRRGSRR